MEYLLKLIYVSAGGKTWYSCVLSIQNKRHAEPHGGGLGIRESWTETASEWGTRTGHGSAEATEMPRWRALKGAKGLTRAAEKTPKGTGRGTDVEGKET